MKYLRFSAFSFQFRARRFCAAVALLSACLGLASGSIAGETAPRNLGHGLYELVCRQEAAKRPVSTQAKPAFVDQAAAVDARRGMKFDADGRVLVDLVLDGSSTLKRVSEQLNVAAGGKMQVVAKDESYRAGILEAYVPADALATLARTAGVMSIHACIKPRFQVGKVTTQGVVQHRVKEIIKQYDGTGITVGVMSDSYDAATTTVSGDPLTDHAADDVASGDLPAGVAVLQEGYGLDEGRAMLQIVHDMAPGAKLGFATAGDGEVNFANNIRSLAGLAGGTNAQPGFHADIIMDDAEYNDDPVFSEGIVARAINEAAAAGVSYFSAAGNFPSCEAYDSELRLVPYDPAHPGAALAGTNIDLTGVDPSLYAGGFHNFNPAAGKQDIAQTLTAYAGEVGLDLQWDDPYDVTPPAPGATLLSASGTLTDDAPTEDFKFAASAGQHTRIDVHGISAQAPGGKTPISVAILVFGPDGQQISNIQESDPVLLLTFPTTGNYTIRVSGVDTTFGEDTGSFQLVVSAIPAVPERVTSDFNALFFNGDTGAFIGALASDNIANQRPVESGYVGLPNDASGNPITNVELVITLAQARPATPTPAHRLHYFLYDPYSYPAEYFSPTTPTIYGHTTALGAISVAAYSPFRPYIPELFTSSGPATIAFSDDYKRLSTPDIRLKPDLAAMDGGNTTFFGTDSDRDLDTAPNFFGTSGATPHAAAIGALVLQAHGGPGTVTPAQMKTILQRSAFQHDLDPRSARGVARTSNGGKVTVSATDDDGYQYVLRPNPDSFTVSYVGEGSVASLLFDVTKANPTGGSVLGSYPGLAFNPSTDPDTFFGVPGVPFMVGDSVGLTADDVTVTYDDQTPAPNNTQEYGQLSLVFPSGVFTGGKALRFGVDRDQIHSAYAPDRTQPNNGGVALPGNSGDLLGAGVLIPQGTVASGGMTFSGTMSDGTTFNGVMTNRIGAGYSVLDGYGFINAQNAVAEPLPK